jgi:glycosyltransferase involved in cell wall biosynthesis
MSKVLIWEALPFIAGGQRVALQIANALTSKYECIFFVPGKGQLTEELEKNKIAYYEINIGNYNIGRKNIADFIKYIIKSPYVISLAYKYIKKEKINLIYVNAARNFIWASILGSVLSIPVIWHVHNIFHDKKVIFIFKMFSSFKSIKKIIFVSKATMDNFKCPEYKKTLIYNGIDLEIYKNIERSAIRQEYKINKFKRIIVCVGWIMQSKNQKVLLDCIPIILKKDKNVHFLFIGGIRKGHENYFNYINNLTRSYKIEDYVTFTGHRKDVPQILNEAYLNIINSEEAFPFSLLESWASGVPTIGANIGGIKELITPYETGLLYKYNNYHDLAKKIIILLDSQDLYYYIKKRVKERIKEYSIQNFNNKILKIIDEVALYENIINKSSI